mmetsp:Transcript_20097/g.62163  ORF Transcript_20097/g.62163 Transcript_20097/m.62163 type:complete len:245 (-) Transcript_20097:23-757(-)
MTAPWSSAEQAELDEALRATLGLQGKERWRRVGELVPSRDAQECLDRYRQVRAALKAQAPPPPEAPEVPRPERGPSLSVVVPKNATPAPPPFPVARPATPTRQPQAPREPRPPPEPPKPPEPKPLEKPIDDFTEVRVPKSRKPMPRRAPAVQPGLTRSDVDDASFFWGDANPPQKAPPPPKKTAGTQQPKQQRHHAGSAWGSGPPAATTPSLQTAQPSASSNSGAGKKKKKPQPKLKNLAMTFK